MCEDCGCGDAELVPIDVHERILAGNDKLAAHLREHFVEAHVLAINLMGSPGAGKTAVLEQTARATRNLRLGAVSGDLATDRDAQRLRAAGITASSITTGSACHLDAKLVHDALHDLCLAASPVLARGVDGRGLPPAPADSPGGRRCAPPDRLGSWRELDVFFIENVGNLVCPAIYDLGQAANVVALSVTEGEDKPLKYPVMFRRADLVLLTKIDLLPHLDVDVAAIRDALAHVMPEPRVIAVSGKTGQGIGEWLAWLEARRP